MGYSQRGHPTPPTRAPGTAVTAGSQPGGSISGQIRHDLTNGGVEA
jgi:hypothetical protein